MSIKLEIDGYMRPFEYAALSVFFAELAKNYDDGSMKLSQYVDDKPLTDLLGNTVGEAPTWAPETSPSVGPASEGKVLRERGKPAPGRARRTKEEIAEDEASEAVAAHVAAGGKTTTVGELMEKQAISTGGERVNPDEEQDAADEAAEQQATTKELTLEDVKAAVGLYIKKWEIDGAQADGPAIFRDVLGAPPAGQDYWKFSILPQTQEAYAKVIKAWTDAAAAGKRYGQ